VVGERVQDEVLLVAARVLEHIRAQTVLMNPGRDEEVEAVRSLATELLPLPDTNRYISGMMSGLDIRYPGLGPRMTDLELITGGGPTRLSRLMHSGRGLLLSLDGGAGPWGTGPTGSSTSRRRPARTPRAPRLC
jgi:hypothetical protein